MLAEATPLGSRTCVGPKILIGLAPSVGGGSVVRSLQPANWDIRTSESIRFLHHLIIDNSTSSQYHHVHRPSQRLGDVGKEAA